MGSTRMKSAEEYDKMIKELQQKKREAAAIEKKRKAALMKRNIGKRNEKLYHAMSGYLKKIGVTDEMLVNESVESLEAKIVRSFSDGISSKIDEVSISKEDGESEDLQ